MLLPGPPYELKALFEAECIPRLRAKIPPQHIATRTLKMAMMPESQVDARVAPIYKTYTDVETTILAGAGEIQLHLRCRKEFASRGRSARRRTRSKRSKTNLGDAIFSRKGETIEQIVSYLLQMRSMTLAVAESCTGGLLAERITSLSGSSRYFLGGAVVYSNALKTQFANVPKSLIDQAWRGQPRSGGGDGRGHPQALPVELRSRNHRSGRPRAAAPSRSRWAWSTSRWREKKARRSSSAIFPATANASASSAPSRRWR